jgi:phosphoglycolate phosphatase
LIVKYESIIWDWNGTLLDDVQISIQTINAVLSFRNLEQITEGRYLDIFTFPVRDYYAQLGFNFDQEPFEIPAAHYIKHYNQAAEKCLLHQDVIATLTYFQTLGCHQFVLSAMEQKQLDKMLSDHDLTQFFVSASGLNHHLATSKLENGQLLVEKYKLNPSKTLLIGDTIHDYEVAKLLGCSCVLTAHGHQSHARLVNSGAPVVKHLKALVKVI